MGSVQQYLLPKQVIFNPFTTWILEKLMNGLVCFLDKFTRMLNLIYSFRGFKATWRPLHVPEVRISQRVIARIHYCRIC